MSVSGGAEVQSAPSEGNTPAKLEELTYDDAAPRAFAFAFATIIWGIVGMLVATSIR
jgi:cbb3-type cytochrome oxidase subunit 1